MYLPSITKYLLFSLCAVLISSSAMGQQFQTSKYNSEYNPYFKFEQFKRGEKSELLTKKLDKLKGKGKANWTLQDSIEFAEISLLTNNIELSHYYLESITNHNYFSKKAMMLLVMDCYIELDFKNGIKTINDHFSNSVRKDQYLMDIFKAHENLHVNGQLDSLIFNVSKPYFSSIKKGSKQFNDEIIEPLEKITEVLRFFVKFIHKDDPVLGRAFNEVGLILENNVSLNQAYVAFSIARIYNAKDKEILENVKRIKAKHVTKNYNTPKFRTYFPRIEYWRFDYEILKEKIIREKNDTIPKFEPNLISANKERKFPFPIDILIPAGIGVILLLFIIFTKSRKRR